VKEVDDPSLILIDFRDPALTPRLNWIEFALRRSLALIAIRGIHTSVIGKEGQTNTWCLGAIIYIQGLDKK
jgi:hypothetical protein